jgi:hypothetical protein
MIMALSKLEELLKQAREYTDAGEWKHSWHWPRGEYGPDVKTLESALKDLHCGNEIIMERELADAINRIKARYKLATKIEEYLKSWQD